MIIVSRDRPDLQAHFEAAFAGMTDVKVIRDRRLGAPAVPGAEFQRAEPDRYTELQERGFLIIRIW